MKIADEERRRRLVARHHLARTASEATEVPEAVAALHSTDPTSPYLAALARVPEFRVEHLEDQLYRRRSLIRMHTIRRTLFIVPLADVPVFEAGAAREVARKERVRLEGWLSEEMPAGRVAGWLDELSSEVVAALSGSELTTRELTGLVPRLGTEVTLGSGKWMTRVPVSSRLLFLLAMDGVLVRTSPAGSWRSSQYRWALLTEWSGAPQPKLDEEVGRHELARRYLTTHGPVTMNDLRWWTGWPLRWARHALSGLEIAEVSLDGDDVGLILDGDTDQVDDPGAAVAFLPSLDSSVMGWKDRDWYLGSHGSELFDSNGNAGPSVWVGGRMVGGWGQNPDGEVIYELLEECGPSRKAEPEIATEAGNLTRWLDGQLIMPRFPTPLGRRLST